MPDSHKLFLIAASQWRPCNRCTDPMDCGSWASCCSPATHAPAAVEIDPKAADLRIEVAGDGVSIGFFTGDGRCALLNLDTLSAGGSVSSESASALREWADDRRKQASAVPA